MANNINLHILLIIMIHYYFNLKTAKIEDAKLIANIDTSW